uniref:Carbohydrate sulfotransferase n=1 Tax=Anopheles culicifacies TaxID=139723 RepID=A0A182MUV9_9DIPT
MGSIDGIKGTESPRSKVDTKNHSLVYCLVFKAATSSWFYNFNSWAGYSEYEIMHIDNLFLARKFYPKENRLTLMQSMEHSFSFIVVRHPFERLMSAFEDRLVSKKNAYYTRVAQAIYKRYHPIGRGSISFRDFVQYIIDDVEHNNGTIALDIHWCPINNLCTPCLARYDFIIKLETYKQDVENMIRATNLQGVVKLAQLFQFKTLSWTISFELEVPEKNAGLYYELDECKFILLDRNNLKISFPPALYLIT